MDILRKENFKSTDESLSWTYMWKSFKNISSLAICRNNHDQNGFILGMQNLFEIWKSIPLIHYIEKTRQKRHTLDAKRPLINFNTQ